MFRQYFDNLQVLNSYTFISQLATHTHAFEYFCWVRTSTNRTRFTSTVMLTVSSLTNTTKIVAFYNTLETFTLRSTDYINETSIF